MKEIWKQTYISEKYEVSNFGNIRNYKTKKILRGGLDSYGYKRVTLNSKNKKIHRLVLETFNPNENSKNLQVNHIDGNKLNNNLENLEWCTNTENMKHAWETGLITSVVCSNKGESNGRSKLTKEDILSIRNLCNEGKLHREVANIFNVTREHITQIVNKKRWSNL